MEQSVFHQFVTPDGGIVMIIVFVLLIVFEIVSIWKAPAWTRKIGNISLLTGFLFIGICSYTAMDETYISGEFNYFQYLESATKGAFSVLSGSVIFLVSRIVNIIRTPRI